MKDCAALDRSEVHRASSGEMSRETNENLPPEAQIAISHSLPEHRDALRIFLELDGRFARIVAGTSEPMLGQMRLTWWRETLARPIAERPSGDAVLDAIGAHWSGREAGLVKLVDGWEYLLAEPPLSEEDARGFIEGRSAALCAVYADLAGEQHAALRAPAWRWACADLAANVTLQEERDLLIRVGLELDNSAASGALPREVRGLAVLGALGVRALKRGARPLMEGRSAALVATRAAIIGR